MEEREHSSLLKFIVNERQIPAMSNTDYETQLSNGAKIESAVPREQKIRETIDDDLVIPQEDFVFSPVMTVTKEEVSLTKGDVKLQKISVSEDVADSNTLEPAKTADNGVNEHYDEVFKKPVRRSRRDDKDEIKKPKTRIPTLRFRQAVDQLRQDRGSFEDKRIEDRKGPEDKRSEDRKGPEDKRSEDRKGPEDKRSEDRKGPEDKRSEDRKGPEDKRSEDRKGPEDKRSEDRKGPEDKRSEDRKEPKTPRITPRRSSIPRLKDSRIPPPTTRDATPQKAEEIELTPRLSDEFDKLYHEIADDQDSLSNLSIISKIDDPVKVENTFEEIIHAYEANEVQTVTVEKVKVSKIPLLKRKSEQEIEIPKQPAPVPRQSVSVDATKVKSSMLFTEKPNSIQSVTLNKSPIRINLTSKTETEESTNESIHLKSPNVIDTEGDDDKNNNKRIPEQEELKGKVINEPQIGIKEHLTTVEIKEAVKVATPDIKTMTCEKIKKTEEQNYTQKYDKEINSVAAKKIVLKKETKTEDGIIEKIQKNENTNSQSPREDKNEEDIPILRGKVSRILNRINSVESDVKPVKKNAGDEIHKNKSLFSKIAMFERPEPVDETPKPKIRCISKIPGRKIDDTYLHTVPDNKPKIVEEVLKAKPARVNEDDNNNITPTINNSIHEPTKMPTLIDGVQTLQIKIVDIQPIMAVQSVIKDEIETNIAVNQNLDDHDSLPDDKIIDIRPIKPIQPLKAEEATINSDEAHKTNDITDRVLIQTNNKDTSITNNQQKDTDKVEKVFESVKVVEMQEKQVNDENNQNLTNNEINVTKNINQGDLKTAFNRIESNKKHLENSCKNKEQINVNDSKPENDIKITPVILSNIVQQEVKYDLQLYTNKEAEKVTEKRIQKDEGLLRTHSHKENEDMKAKSKSLAELDLGNAVKGKVGDMVVRMNSLDWIDSGRKEVIDVKERPRKRSVSEKIALFERKLAPVKVEKHEPPKLDRKELPKSGLSDEEFARRVEELSLGKARYGALEGAMPHLGLRDGGRMPVMGLGTALLEPKLARYIVAAAIDLGYRTIDTAYIYGNEREVGEGIREKIRDGTVVREDLFIISKLWSTFHRRDLVAEACRASLEALGLDYFDLYLIHNPMSFKEGGAPVPKIASVVQYSQHEYLEAWYGMEDLVRRGLVRRAGLSNFNSAQVDRVVEKGKIKPVVNQVECHPYLSQHRLADFCEARGVKLCCFGVLGSPGTPAELRSALSPPVEDPLVRVMAAGMGVSPAALLISYQLSLGRAVVVKASSAANLHDNLRALALRPSAGDLAALHALNRNKRTFTFKGMGDTHRHYPFNIPF